jgi:two-component system OmpR family response regulator
VSRNDKKIRIFSALEVANICGVVNQTAINWIRNGYLKAFTTPGGQYRVYAEELMSFLEKRGMRVPDELADLMKDDINWSTILVVDDDQELNGLLKRWFEKKLPGYTVVQAFDGFEAGKALAENRPGFVILDIDLPGVDGHKVCRKIKDDPSFGKPFIISITGLDIPEERISILEDGADAFFAKPLDFDLLTSTIVDLGIKTEHRIDA